MKLIFWIEIASSIIKVANEQKEINISDVVVDLVETIQGNYDGKSLSMYKGNWKTLSSVSFEADKGYPNGKSRGRLFTQIGQVEYSSPILPPDRSFHKKVKQSVRRETVKLTKRGANPQDTQR